MWYDEPPPDEQEFAARLHAEHHSRARPHRRNGPAGSSRPRPSPYRSRPSRPSSSHARHVERENDDGDHRDDQQNVNHDADSDDEDEHARLAVNFEAIEF